MSDPVERVVLRRVSPDLAFAEVRLRGVNLTGLRVERGSGGIRITPPMRAGRDGREWPIYALQPGTREAVEASIRDAWASSLGGRAGGSSKGDMPKVSAPPRV